MGRVPKDDSPLLHTAERGHGHIVKILLEAVNMLPNQRSAFGQTALSLAAASGKTTIVKILLAAQPTT